MLLSTLIKAPKNSEHEASFRLSAAAIGIRPSVSSVGSSHRSRVSAEHRPTPSAPQVLGHTSWTSVLGGSGAWSHAVSSDIGRPLKGSVPRIISLMYSSVWPHRPYGSVLEVKKWQNWHPLSAAWRHPFCGCAWCEEQAKANAQRPRWRQLW